MKWKIQMNISECVITKIIFVEKKKKNKLQIEYLFPNIYMVK